MQTENFSRVKIRDVAREKKTRRPRILTEKDKIALSEYLKTGSVTEAAKAIAGEAKLQAKRNTVKKVIEITDVPAILEQSGITHKLIAQTLRGSMEANNIRNKPDWAVRLKGVEIAAKIKGYFKQQVDVTSAGKAIPLLGGGSVTYVQNNYGTTQNNASQQEDPIRKRRDIVEQDDINPDVAD